MVNNNLIPFDLEKAKAGKAVITRDGRKISDIFFPKHTFDGDKIICVIESHIHTYYINGYRKKDFPSPDDLFMAEEEMYVNVYENGDVSLSYDLQLSKKLGETLEGYIGTYKLVKV